MTFLNTLQIISLSNNTIFHCVHISNVLVLHFWHSIGVTSAYSAEPPWLARPSRPQRPLVLGRAWILQNRKRQQRHTADVANTLVALPGKNWPWQLWTLTTFLVKILLISSSFCQFFCFCHECTCEIRHCAKGVPLQK